MQIRPLLLAVFAASLSLHGRAQASLSPAQAALMDGRLDESIALSRSNLKIHTQDASSNLLLCRAFFAEEHADEAIAACQAAVHAQPKSSEAQDWMGRVDGLRASHAGALSGFRLARQVRTAFETAVELDPHNADAVNDLGEYYVGAPSIVGGGLEKADALATRSLQGLPQAAHRIRGLAAEKRKDFATAEREFQLAAQGRERLATAAAQADLGAFYGRQKQLEKAQAALTSAIAIAGTHVPAVDAASSLTDIGRSPDLAARTFAAYLAGANKSDAEPAPRVHVLLGRLLAAKGDSAGAKIEFQQALSLASSYAAAKQALQNLK